MWRPKYSDARVLSSLLSLPFSIPCMWSYSWRVPLVPSSLPDSKIDYCDCRLTNWKKMIRLLSPPIKASPHRVSCMHVLSVTLSLSLSLYTENQFVNNVTRDNQSNVHTCNGKRWTLIILHHPAISRPHVCRPMLPTIGPDGPPRLQSRPPWALLGHIQLLDRRWLLLQLIRRQLRCRDPPRCQHQPPSAPVSSRIACGWNGKVRFVVALSFVVSFGVWLLKWCKGELNSVG